MNITTGNNAQHVGVPVVPALRRSIMTSVVPGALLLALLLAADSAADAQAVADNERLAFEVASVRENRSGETTGRIRDLPGGRFEAVNVPLREIIRRAWELERLAPQQLVGVPGWADTTRYDIVATAARPFGPRQPDGALPDDLRAMLRSLLEDRFQIRGRREQREMAVYEMVLARPDGALGPGLTRADGRCRGPNTRPTGENSLPLCPAAAQAGFLQIGGSTMEDLTRFLARLPLIEQVVLDRTGLDGLWDMQITYTPAFIDNPNNPAGPAVANPAADSGTTIFTALPEQLGLRLRGTRAPVDVFIVEHLERPSEN